MLQTIAHLTPAHPRNDTRIFHKMCKSLAATGYRVTLVVADGKGSGVAAGIVVQDVGKPFGQRAQASGPAKNRSARRALGFFEERSLNIHTMRLLLTCQVEEPP